MDEESVESVRALRDVKPRTVAEVRQLLGLLGYHRRHIQDFATIAKPLTDLLKGDHTNKKHQIEWTEAHRDSLDRLIKFATTPPILAYPDYNQEMFIHTDASQQGLGCILYQIQEGKRRVIAYGSRTLLPAEKNYHSTKLEFLALKWAICEKFRDYVAYADHFTVYTDNNPLLYIMTNSKLNANGQRWVSELSEFNFTIKYRPGIVNRDADCLSRLPLDISKYQRLCNKEIKPDVFQALAAAVEVQSNNREVWVSATYCNNADDFELKSDDEVVSAENIKDSQQKDLDISRVIYFLKSNEKVTKSESRLTRSLLRDKKKLFIDENGILKRKSNGIEQVVWPQALRHIIYDHLHVNMGHLMTDRVYQLARKRVFWPRMYQDIDTYIHSECRCIVNRKPDRTLQAPLISIHTSSPMELVAIDFLHLETSSRGYEYVLLIVDHFTRFAQAYPTKNKSALTAAKHLYGDFILRFGVPTRIMHDQGREFENKLFNELEKLTGVKKSRTTPYHPQTNGACERMNKTLLQMMRTLEEKEKLKWHDKLNKLTFAYNCTQHETTGYSPYYLLFGREPSLFLDRLIGAEPIVEKKTHEKYINEWKDQMQEAYEIAFQRAAKKKTTDRRRQLRKTCLTPLQSGDRVLLKNVVERGGPGKLRSYWERKVYRIEDCQGPVYTVIDENNKQAKRRVVHRNMIMLVDDKFQLNVPRNKKEPNKKKTQQPSSQDNETHQGKADEFDESEDEEATFQLVQGQQEDGEEVQDVHSTLSDDDNHEMMQPEYDEEPTNQSEIDDNELNDVQSEDEEREPRPKRQRRPRQIFTYDRPGEPSVHAIAITERNLPMHSGTIPTIQGHPYTAIHQYVPPFWPYQVSSFGQDQDVHRSGTVMYPHVQVSNAYPYETFIDYPKYCYPTIYY